MSAQEWNDTPWWVQRLYLEGLEQEEIITLGFTPPDDTIDVEADPLGADITEYAKLGLRVIDGG